MRPPEPFGSDYIALLMLLVATVDQVYFVTDLAKIDPVSGAEIYSQFRNTFPNGFDIAKVAFFDAIDSLENDGLRSGVQSVEPVAEWEPTVLVFAYEYFSGKGFHES